MFNDPGLITLTAVTLLAAVVNGGLGYGFSSITVPVALIFYANRILNPALVLVEVALNGYLLFINRKSVPLAWKRVIPILAGLIFGVGVGSQLLSRANPEWLKLFTYAVVLPLMLLQAAGVRRQIHSAILPSVAIGIPLGAYLIRHMPVETFRRICMSFDAWIVGFGLSRVLIVLQLLRGPAAYSIWLSVIMIDAYLLYLFFGGRQS